MKVRGRRNLVSENWLLQQSDRLSRQLQSSLSNSQKEQLILRLIGELAELLLPPKIKDGEDQGRTSGDIIWRQTRGETGLFPKKQYQPVVWTPSENEMITGEFFLEYRYNRTVQCNI